MSLKRKALTINDTEYEVREITIGQVLPILPRLEDPEQAQDAQMDIMKMCIVQDGEAIGDAVVDLGLSSYLKLAEEVMVINGLSEVGKDLTPT